MTQRWTVKDDLIALIEDIERTVNRGGSVYKNSPVHKRLQRTLSMVELERADECYDRDGYGSGSDGW